ncbi:50S ribosomal protein L10 [Haliangium ochraceum]|uniref:Large ribosomal subunit protein uL10 n=1 Tax=Haliangium ochraceum (strain DSM 14365 / JCM 11303 / SMP-2) TaxID=502025 RepID=D0LJE3_HALO1|nr:50S ribosomal protein L10 [Haliangium ochraceum]ACY16517.1 ribosomal protein L10 [Haliangium ochraceum DSM 14365]
MDRLAKEQVVNEMKGTMSNVMSVVVADYRGLDVPTVTHMREEFRKAGCGYRVVKNTLLKIAVKGSDVEPLSSLLSGPTAVMWSNESPSAPAKLALQFAKEKKAFNIRGGYFEGQVLDMDGVERLSKMPGKQELQATLLMTFLAAPQNFVRQIIAAPQNFAYLIDARKRSLEGGA